VPSFHLLEEYFTTVYNSLKATVTTPPQTLEWTKVTSS